jgi:predicted AAA+ superfamily ATPase
LRHALDDYLTRGGFIATQRLDAFDATQLLQEYANRAVGYDILERYNISNPRAASMFLARCVASSGREMSINKVSNEFKSRGVSVGRDTLARLLAYFEESYLVFSVREFSVALADNPRSRTKVYAADPALFAAFSPAPSKDAGQRLETAVFNKLRREAPSQRAGVVSRAFVGEGSGRSEIDFVVGDAMAGERTMLVQVSVDVSDDRTRGRELSALDRGMERFGVHDAWLVTEDSEGEFEVANGTVHMAPAWKWLI